MKRFQQRAVVLAALVVVLGLLFTPLEGAASSLGPFKWPDDPRNVAAEPDVPSYIVYSWPGMYFADLVVRTFLQGDLAPLSRPKPGLVSRR
jgi:hypothetical protein